MRKLAYFIVVIVLTLLVGQAVYAQDEEEPGVSADVIAANPRPNITQLYANANLVNDRIYRRVEGATDIFDGPNGAYKSTLGEGFNFVTVLQFVGEWAEISPGSWVRIESLSENVAQSTFAGVLLPDEPLEYEMAWILVNLYPSEEPGGEPSEANELLLRYTTVNIFDTVVIDDWNWYQIGVDQWVQQTMVAKVLPIERPEGVDTERWVSVDLYEQVAIAYEDEKPVFATLVSSGLPQWSTNEGIFNIYVRYDRTIMSGANGQPDFYYLEEVPWTMYFDDDIALHGAYWHDGFGYRRSHGCVNMSITDAHWLYNWTSAEFDFTEPGDVGASVYVYSSGVYQ